MGRNDATGKKCNSSSNDLSDGGLVVCQTQQEHAGFVDLDGHSSSSPLHLAHGDRLLGPRLSDQGLWREK